MTNNEASQKILSNLTAEFDKVNEMCIYTKDMENALNTQDEQAFGLLLDMRKKLMDSIDVLKQTNSSILSEISPEDREKISLVLSEKNQEAHFETSLENDIFETKKRISNLMQKLIKDNAKVEAMLKTEDR